MVRDTGWGQKERVNGRTWSLDAFPLALQIVKSVTHIIIEALNYIFKRIFGFFLSLYHNTIHVARLPVWLSALVCPPHHRLDSQQHGTDFSSVLRQLGRVKSTEALLSGIHSPIHSCVRPYACMYLCM